MQKSPGGSDLFKEMKWTVRIGGDVFVFEMTTKFLFLKRVFMSPLEICAGRRAKRVRGK